MSHAPRISTDVLEHNHFVVVFVNIDWKASRHATVASANRNMTLLTTTVRSIVRTHEPVVICFCEVGEASNPLTLCQMSTLSQAIEDTWHELLQSTQLQHAFEQGYPYLTVWDSSRVHCFNFHITKCYEPQPFRTAQLFGMRAATLEVDIVNIHLSSGKQTLTDAARKGSLRSILQKKSSLHDGTIGESRSFLLGGDMNTSRTRMSLIFSTLKREHLLQSDVMPNIIEAPHGKHGDLAVAMDQDVSLACGKAMNHDPQHVPVALKLPHSQTALPTQQEELERVRRWRPAYYNNSVSSGAASEIAEDARPQDSPTSPCTATEHAESIMILPDLHAHPSREQGNAQLVRFCPQTALPTQKEELEHVRTGHLRPAHYNTSVSSCAAAEMPEDARPQDSLTSPGTATEHGPDSPCTATEHAEAQQDDDKNANHLGPEAEKLYCSISLLMWSANLDNLEVEKIIHDCIQERLKGSYDVIDSMEEICYPFFFADRGDNSKWKPHDLYQIIQNLLWYDWFRQRVLHRYGLPATTTLTETQCAECWKDFLNWFRQNELRPDQRRGATSTYMAARMHRDVGNRFAVYSTWKFGLPTMGEPLRQTCLQAAMLQSVLSWQDKRALWEHVDLCISWCQWVAEDIRQRKSTEKYVEDKRKSGSWKQTGLNDTELAARQHKQQQQHRWRR